MLPEWPGGDLAEPFRLAGYRRCPLDIDRHYGDYAVREAPFVGVPVVGFEVLERAGKPIEFMTVRVYVFLILIIPFSAARGAKTHLCRDSLIGRDIDIQADILRQTVLKNSLY